MPLQAQDDRDQFAPPRPPGRARAVALAALAHLVLIAALTWGVSWKTSADQPAVEAELWSAVPQQAAPRAVQPPAPKPPPEPKPEPPPPEPAKAPPPPPPPQAEPDNREADIALQKQKERLEQEKKLREQQLQREKEQREKAEKEKAQKEKAEREKAEKARAEKEKAEKEKAEREKAEREKREAQKKAEAEKQKKLAEEKRKAEADARRAEELRQEQLRRIQGLAGATGGENATGNAQRSSGPSGSYGGKVAAKVKPNIVYPDVIPGNPRAEVEVRAAPDGTITSVRLTQSSGNKAWDDAVVRALYKTETLPRDVDGRVPPALVIGFRPKD
ncbi:hypothetical protein GCM10022279_25980 [Comamonas faecalis]|uniref:Cell envelope integrity protein TolA n=1 Tax=Comamonas faecalis TaxID=1387849 RepID=A0ABP7RQX2_9BURK